MGVNILRDLLKSRPTFVCLFMLLLMLFIDFPLADIPESFLIKDAEARIGRPASPGSVAGVHRRTRRRTVRRVAIGTRVYALPAGYTTVAVAGVTYYVHDGTYYKAYYEGNKVVYVAVDKP